jgi:folate-binding protein YgfZ
MSDALTVELDAQYRQLREGCGLLDRSDRGKLLVTGPEAVEYLQGQLTNDIEALEPGDGCYAALLDRKGHMQADMRVLRWPGEAPILWIDTEPEAAAVVHRHLETYKIGRDVSVEDAGAERAIISLIGPATGAVAATPSLPPYACEATTIFGIECLAAGSEEGIDLISAAADRDPLRAALLKAGAAEVDAAAAEILRVEAGRPRYGADVDEDRLILEAGMDDAVSMTKGCYLGQEVVARATARGHINRKLVGLRVEGAGPVTAGAKLSGPGRDDAGLVTSSVVSPRFGAIALGYVHRTLWDPGTELVVHDVAGERKAKVADLPFRG